MESLKAEITSGYREKIATLEDQLRSVRPSAEQSVLVGQLQIQLREIEKNLDRKTRTLESLHIDICSASCSTPSEDVSVKGSGSNVNSPIEVIFILFNVQYLHFSFIIVT